ncbi:MAG: BlaI/MecI/CopY family transcriptional regulator [Muribaculaceae bacterium]|nr:BlaI/MecI/CopY family transcriptional regulator [Muribaculaceae bacterium]
MAKKGRLKELLTRREEELLQMLWGAGKPMAVRELLTLFPDPQPHFNTVSTVVRGLEEKGFVSHNEDHDAFRYFPTRDRESLGRRSLGNVIKGYFNNSYLNVVSTLVEDDSISIAELKELIEMIEKKKNDR